MYNTATGEEINRESESVRASTLPRVDIHERHTSVFPKAVPSEEKESSEVKTLLFLFLIILISLSCVSVVGIVWFGPRWPTYEITYTLRNYLLKIGVPLPAILSTLSVFITIVIGICIYLCFGNP